MHIVLGYIKCITENNFIFFSLCFWTSLKKNFDFQKNCSASTGSSHISPTHTQFPQLLTFHISVVHLLYSLTNIDALLLIKVYSFLFLRSSQLDVGFDLGFHLVGWMDSPQQLTKGKKTEKCVWKSKKNRVLCLMYKV